MSDPTATIPTPPETALPSGRHPVNVAHLVMGVAFLGLTLVWALIASDTVEGNDIRWLMPIPWVAAGAAGVLASILAGRSNGFAQRQTGWVTPDPGTDAGPESADTDTTSETDESPEENR